jgi:hypothetical protein
MNEMARIDEMTNRIHVMLVLEDSCELTDDSHVSAFFQKTSFP